MIPQNQASNESYPYETILDFVLERIMDFERTPTNKTAQTHNFQAEKPALQPAAASFYAELSARRLQSQNSVVIQILSLSTAQELLDICSAYGDIRDVYYYTLDKNKEFLLIEYDLPQSLRKFLDDVNFRENHPVIPVPSQFLVFWGEKEKAPSDLIKIYKPPSNTEIRTSLQTANSVSEQMVHLHNFLKLPDLSSRLRFLNCAQIEKSLHGIFPHGQVYPFGSSVNSFGKYDSDLDMIFCLDSHEHRSSRNSLLVFQAKRMLSNDRSQAQRSLETFSFFLSDFLPGCVNVHRILQARVPIIKYQHAFTGLDCDLTVSNLSGLHMSELLFLIGEVDHRVRPLVFTIRKWARENHITHIVPGNWVSNFQLLMLVLFFLQQRQQPVIPSIEKLLKVIAKQQKNDGSSILPRSNNQEDLGNLLQEFFVFYENFDFKERGISILSGIDVCKPDYAALYLQNPLETELNASKNVTKEEINRMKSAFRNALWKLEAEGQPHPKKQWGLLKLFETDVKPKSNEMYSFQVNSLFEDKVDNLPKGRFVNSFEYTAQERSDFKQKTQNIIPVRPLSLAKSKNTQKSKKISGKKH